MKPPFRLIHHSVSHDTVEVLRRLLQEAERGHLVGLAYTAMLRSRQFVVGASGEAHRNPTFALGMVRLLDDDLVERARGGHPSPTPGGPK